MNYLLNKENYLEAVKYWKTNKQHSAIEHIIYNIVRTKDPQRGFSPITKNSKLNNGMRPLFHFEIALWSLKASTRRYISAKDEDKSKIISEQNSYFKQLTSEDQKKIFDFLSQLP